MGIDQVRVFNLDWKAEAELATHTEQGKVFQKYWIFCKPYASVFFNDLNRSHSLLDES